MHNRGWKAFGYISLYVAISAVILLILHYFRIRPFSSIVPNINDIHTNSGVLSSDVGLKINNDCSFSGSSYRYLDVANYDNPINTPSKPNLANYTKKIHITGNVSVLYFCIISDVRKDYKVKGAYYFDTYAYFGSDKNRGHLNVGYNVDKGLTYDNSTDTRSPNLDGKFYGNETPFVQILNGGDITIANMEDGSYKSISPIQLFANGTDLLIGGYVNSYPNYRAGKIIMFRIIYKGGEVGLTK